MTCQNKIITILILFLFSFFLFSFFLKQVPSKKLSFKLEYWESQNLMFINQLKGIVIELSNWESDVQLMKYLLKNTKELERAIIIYSQTVPTNLIIELRKYKTPPTELVCYHKSSKFVRQVSLTFRIVGIEYFRQGKFCDSFFFFSRWVYFMFLFKIIIKNCDSLYFLLNISFFM